MGFTIHSMLTCVNPRRLLLVALVLAALSQVGCAQYEIKRHMADRGTVLLTWEVGGYVPAGHCGWASQIAQNHYLVTFRRKPDFNSLCLPHELIHAFGGSHQ